MQQDYSLWIRTVGAFVPALTGGMLTIGDLQYPYQEDFETGLTPRAAAEKAIQQLRERKYLNVREA